LGGACCWLAFPPAFTGFPILLVYVAFWHKSQIIKKTQYQHIFLEKKSYTAILIVVRNSLDYEDFFLDKD
jgi:uncharacterized membrane protein YbaN (DUF454 family)